MRFQQFLIILLIFGRGVGRGAQGTGWDWRGLLAGVNGTSRREPRVAGGSAFGGRGSRPWMRGVRGVKR